LLIPSGGKCDLDLDLAWTIPPTDHTISHVVGWGFSGFVRCAITDWIIVPTFGSLWSSFLRSAESRF